MLLMCHWADHGIFAGGDHIIDISGGFLLVLSLTVVHCDVDELRFASFRSMNLLIDILIISFSSHGVVIELI